MCCLFETDDCSLQYSIREWEDSKRDNTRTRVDYSLPSFSITLCYMVLFVTWRFRTKRVLICMIVLSLLGPPRTNVSLFYRCRSHNAAKQFCCCFRHVLWKNCNNLCFSPANDCWNESITRYTVRWSKSLSYQIFRLFSNQHRQFWWTVIINKAITYTHMCV